MYESWQISQWSGSGNGRYGGSWRKPGNWCDPEPVCPPTTGKTDGWPWVAQTTGATDPNIPSECETDDKDTGDAGWARPGTNSWSRPGIDSWSWPDGDGCCCSFDHHGPWQGGGFGHYGPWKSGYGNGYGSGHGWPGHGQALPFPSEGFLTKLYGLLGHLPGDGVGSLGGLLGGLLPGGLGNHQDPSWLIEFYRDNPEQLFHLMRYFAKSLDKFSPSAHWWKPGHDYGGFGDHYPKPCIEPPELGFKVFRHNPDSGDLVDLNDGVGDPGRGNGEPGHRYPWAQEEHQKTLYVGVLNGNPNPLHILPAALSLFTEIPFAPTLHSTGPEIWRWVDSFTAEVAVPGDSAQQVLDLPDRGYWEKVLDGDDLGGALDGQVGVRELFSYQGYLYATTSNNLAPLLLQGSREPAMMIRSKSGDPGTWAEVPRGPGTDDDPFDDPTNTSIRTLEEINGMLVVGTEKASALLGPEAGDPELWTFDGSKWKQVEGEVEGFAISEILGLRAPKIYGLQEGEAEAFGFDTFEQPYFGNWDRDGYNLYTVAPAKPEDDTGDPNAPEFNVAPLPTPVIVDITPTHVRYVGRGPNLDAGEIPDYIIGEPDANGLYAADDFGDVSPFDDLGIIKMFEFDPNPRDEEPGYLYFGTVDYQDGATLMRSQRPDDPMSWELITADGFFSEFGAEAVNTPDSGLVPLLNGNFYIWSAAVMQREKKLLTETLDDPNKDPGLEDSTLYIGTFNGLNGSGQILKSNDGVNFEYVTQDAFGEDNIYGFRSMEVIRDEVFFGGASPITTPDPTSFPYVPEGAFAFDLI